MAKPIEQLELGQTPLVSTDPESDFLATISVRAYPDIKRKRPDISISAIREAAEQFRGARVRDYVGIFLIRRLTEPSLQTTSSPQLAPEITFMVPTASLTLLDRIKKPLQALGIKL